MGFENIFGLEISGFLLAFGRAAGLFMAAPFFQNKTFPVQIRVLFTFCLALVAAPFVHFKDDLFEVNLWVAMVLMVQEALIGLISGFMMNLTFYAVQLSGFFMDTPIGFGMVNVLDPTSDTNIPILGQVFSLITGLIFLTVNGHHTVIISFVKSFETVPPGMFFIKKEATAVFLQAFAQMFILGFQISIPVVGSIFLADVTLGIMAKLMPQINIFVVGYAIKIVIGLMMLILFMPPCVSLIERSFANSGDTFKMMRMMLENLRK